MFFTREDILKIQAELTRLGVKDSDFRDAHTPLDNNDILVLSQGGRNVKIDIRNFLEQLHLLSSDDFINVTTKFDAHHLNLVDAIRIIPAKSRKIGLTITFSNPEGNWEIWQYTSTNLNQWDMVSMWENCKVPVDSIAVPDEEDLTMETVGNKTVTKFKDKLYDPENFSGMGRVYLRKNVTKVQDSVTKQTKTVNLLTQKMLGKENTIYVIQYDYDLNGQEIVVPSGCVLDFLGGQLNGGIITFANTFLLGKVRIASKILGSILNDIIYYDWFNNNYLTFLYLIGLDKIIDFQNITIFLEKTAILGNGTYMNANIRSKSCYDILLLGTENNTIIYNFNIDGDDTALCGIKFMNCSNIKIKNSLICNCFGLDILPNGIYLHRVDNFKIENTTIRNIRGAKSNLEESPARGILINICHNGECFNTEISDITSDNDSKLDKHGDGILILTNDNIALTDVGDILIHKCRIKNCSYRLIKILQRGVTIKDCLLTSDNDYMAAQSNIAVYNSDVNVLCNYMNGKTSIPIVIGVINSAVNLVNNISCIGNTIINNSNAYQATFHIGTPVNNIILSNNTLSDVVGINSALSIRDTCQNILFSSNICTGFSSILDARGEFDKNSVLLINNIANVADYIINAQTKGLIKNSMVIGNSVTFTNTNVPSINDTDSNILIECNSSNNKPVGYRALGYTSLRPVITNADIKGVQFYDYNLGKPIWWNGTKWVDATGADV